MLKFLKFLLGIIILTAFILLVNISFFSDNQNLENIKFNNYSFSGTQINQINYLDNIYTNNSNDFKINEINDNIEIDLKSGVFILELNDISKNYIIKGNGFEINTKGVGDIFIDNSASKNFIFSLNSSIELNFLDKNNKKINSYFLFPHEWIKFNPKLNFIYKKSDLYRIRTTTKNGFLKEKFNLINNKLFFSQFLGEKNIDLFKKYLNTKKYIYEQNLEAYKNINKLKNTDFPFYSYINKYKKYFINDSKRSAFLVNNINNNIIKLLNNNIYDITLIRKIESDLSELKYINKYKYNDVILYFKNIYKVYLLKNNVPLGFKFENIYYLANNKKLAIYRKNYSELHNIYFDYDFLKGNNFVNYFNLFLKSYLKNNGIVEDNKNLGLNKKDKLTEIESFVFYLREYISSYLFLNDLSNFGSEVNILSKYVYLDRMIYFKTDVDSKKIETSLKQNIDLLNRLDFFLKNIFFEEKRDLSKNILIIKEGKKFNFDDLKKFENSIFDLFSLFNKKKEKYSFMGEYKKLFKIISEEFFAIKDYEKYKLEYDKGLKNIYGVTGVGKKENKIYYINDIYLYLSNFNRISFNKSNIVQKGDFFEIKNIFINNKKYIFKLFPYLGNKVEIYDGDSNKFLLSYNLDESKKLLTKKYKSAKSEEKYKYDFKNFFVEKFKGFSSNNTTNSIEDICALKNMIPNINKPGECIVPKIDSDVISVFKKDKLLKEEFISIKDYSDIKYDNIDVKYDGKNYNIYLKNIINKFNIKNRRYELIMNSDYDFKKHEFFNIKFKVKLNGNNNYLFNSAYIDIKFKKVKINNLKLFLKNYLSNISNLQSIYSILNSKLNLINLQIEDIFGKTYFKFSTNNKNIIIKVEKNKILSIIVGNINILENSININDLKNYIDKIK